MLKEAEYKLEELIEEQEVIKLANARAEEIINKAQSNAKDIRLGALDYADSILEETQENLKKLIQVLNDNRKELKGN